MLPPDLTGQEAEDRLHEGRRKFMKNADNETRRQLIEIRAYLEKLRRREKT